MNLSKKTLSIALIILSTFLIGTAQILYKKGAPLLQWNFIAIINNYLIISGLLLYVIGAVIMTYAMKHNSLSTLYPILALSYIWVNIMAGLFLGEVMNPLKWSGSFFILAGVSLIGYGADKV